MRTKHRQVRGAIAARWLATACAITMGLTSAAFAETITKVTIIGGSQQVPPVASPARGCGRFVIDTVANTVDFRISFSGLSSAETAAAIHGPADPGVNGAMLVPLPLGQPKVGVWTYSEAVEGDLLAGKLYVNISTAGNPTGEIRGQIVDMVALLNGAQETPPVATTGLGFGLFNIDRCSNTLGYYISFAGLGSPENAAHIHGFSLHGVGSAPVHPLPPGSPKIGTWTYPEPAEADILAGRTYVNIHTVAFGGGEIRGQITPHVVPLDGLQQTPPLAGIAAHGCAFVALDPPANTLSYYLEYANLTGGATMAHIHGFAAAGAPAGIQHNVGTALPAIGTWVYGAADAPSVLGGLTYFNVHTGANPGGEIRGQILFPPPPCAADTDCNGLVNVSDLLNLLAGWGPCPAPPAPCQSDLNRDGVTDVTDLLALLAAWGPCP